MEYQEYDWRALTDTKQSRLHLFAKINGCRIDPPFYADHFDTIKEMLLDIGDHSQHVV